MPTNNYIEKLYEKIDACQEVYFERSIAKNFPQLADSWYKMRTPKEITDLLDEFLELNKSLIDLNKKEKTICEIEDGVLKFKKRLMFTDGNIDTEKPIHPHKIDDLLLNLIDALLDSPGTESRMYGSLWILLQLADLNGIKSIESLNRNERIKVRGIMDLLGKKEEK